MAGVGVSTTDRLQTPNFYLQPSTALTLTPANFKIVLFWGMSRWWQNAHSFAHEKINQGKISEKITLANLARIEPYEVDCVEETQKLQTMPDSKLI